MERIALHTRLMPGREEAYDALHARVPEALAQDLLAAGVHDWMIWRDGTHLFHALEVADRASMRTIMRASIANLEWQRELSFILSPTRSDGDLPLVWSLQDQCNEGRR